MDFLQPTDKSSRAESLKNPATYLHAALRAFVSGAYERVGSLLDTADVFNFGPNTPYRDLATLGNKLKEAGPYWRDRNAFIADLLDINARKAVEAAKTGDTSDHLRIAREIFKALTNYFFCYIKVDRRTDKPVSTVRVLFP